MDPTPITILRIKRPRTTSPLSQVQVTLPPSKRPRLSSLSLNPLTLTFRRLQTPPSRSALSAPHVTVIDVDQHILSVGRKRARADTDDSICTPAKARRAVEPSSQTLWTCNGCVMERVKAIETDLFVRDEECVLLGVQLTSDGERSEGDFAVVEAAKLPMFVMESESDSDKAETDREEASIDYPSTPETSEGASDHSSEDDDDGFGRRFGFVNMNVNVEEDDEYDEEGHADGIDRWRMGVPASQSSHGAYDETYEPDEHSDGYYDV